MIKYALASYKFTFITPQALSQFWRRFKQNFEKCLFLSFSPLIVFSVNEKQEHLKWHILRFICCIVVVSSDKHSKRVRDLHLLKKLSVLLDTTKSGQGK